MSKDFPQSQDEFNERYMDTRPDDQEFTEIERCVWCDGEVVQHFSGDEGWGICDDCQMIEGDTKTVYQCSLCLKEHEKEECNCYEK